MLTPKEKSPLLQKQLSSEENRTHDTASSRTASPTHYQRAILAPLHELNCFKLGVMLDITKLYSLISVWMTLMFTDGDRVMGKLKLLQSFYWKVAWSNSNVNDGWLCKGDDYGEVYVWQIWVVWAFALLGFSFFFMCVCVCVLFLFVCCCCLFFFYEFHG